MAAGWDKFFTLERNGQLTRTGYAVNAMLAVSCLFALSYPAFENFSIFSFGCPFKALTGVPCPGCGFTRSLQRLAAGDFQGSFLQNPGWIILIIFLATMTGIGVLSLIRGRQVNLGTRWLILFTFLLGCTWIGKFLLGSTYY